MAHKEILNSTTFKLQLNAFLTYLSNKENYNDPKRMEIVVEKTTNEWELLRYTVYFIHHAQSQRPQKIKSSTNICYTNKNNTLKFTGEMELHWRQWMARSKLTDTKAPTKEEITHLHSKKNWLSDAKHRAVLRSQLLARDGDCCFYCGLPLKEDITLEHVLPKMFGGSDDINNLVLSHLECNHKASILNMHDKIKLRDTLHIKFKEVPTSKNLTITIKRVKNLLRRVFRL